MLAADLQGANLSGAIYNDATLFPGDFIPGESMIRGNSGDFIGFASRMAESYARDRGLSEEDLRSITGRGPGGRIRLGDLRRYLFE